MIRACLIVETCNKPKHGFFLGNIPGLLTNFILLEQGLFYLVNTGANISDALLFCQAPPTHVGRKIKV